MSFTSVYNYRKLLSILTMLLTLSITELVAQPPSKDYQLLFEDNFTGEKVNDKHWSFRIGARTGLNINSWNRKENVYQKDSGLHVVVKQEMLNDTLRNTGGGIISKHQFGYGYYECLSKPFMVGKGVHSAFWQAGGVAGNNRIFEIDGYEIDSKVPMGCNNLYVHIAPPGYKEVPWPCRANVPVQFLNDGWFLDAYEYTPQGVNFYDNGQIVAKAEWNELTAAQVVWLTALNGVGTVDVDKLPGETVFKYFRYYAKPYPGINLLPNGNFEYNMGKTMWRVPTA
jgi:beta-glucanase (GH16 family)